jgi:hypothetical protein
VGKVKVVNNKLDLNLIGESPSETIFQFGTFFVTSNFDGKKTKDYSDQLSSFVTPITLKTLNVSETQLDVLNVKTNKVVLNLDKSDLKTFVRFGSAYEFFRISLQNVIVNYPGSLFVNSQVVRGGNVTFSGFTYNPLTNKSQITIPLNAVVNKFGLIVDYGNTTEPDNIALKNLNTSYNKYILWTSYTPTDNTHTILGFTGFTKNNGVLILEVLGNPLPMMTGTSGILDFHIKPTNYVFEEFRTILDYYEKYIVSERSADNSGFVFVVKDPTLLDNGTINYVNTTVSWPTTDKYNIDIDNSNYDNLLRILLNIGSKYDEIKTNLISRFLTPTSIKTYDLTQEGKVDKLLKIYGHEFDIMRQFIDSIAYINTVTYNKVNNIPDQIVNNLARTFGWKYFSLLNESELVSSFLTIDENERNTNTDLLPSEIDIELWRRILINTSYYWKSKGTRDAIKSMFLLIGIPEPFINITEYVYTVNGKIDPRTQTIPQAYFPTNSFPYNNDGYPVAPLETNSFFFQVSGDTDNGQTYMNVFRQAGFNLLRTVDNKKSWIQTGATTRSHSTTPQYYQEDSKLIINTKEIDVALDTARGIEYDVYRYIKEQDFPANSSGYTIPFNYINISLGYTLSANTFTLPFTPEGDFEVRYNGILLNAPKTGTTSGITYQSDYIVNGNQFTLNYPAYYTNNNRDVIQATYVYSGGTTTPISGVTVKYVVTRVKANITGTIVPLPSNANGDIQVTINGIALTKGTNQFTADYIIDPNNSGQIIIQNPEIISYLAIPENSYVQVVYITVTGSTSIAARNELLRIDSFNTSKLYFSSTANKYVYKLNYKTKSANEIKILINGIAIEPLTDYTLNNNNPYEIYLPNGLKYGDVISVYYLIGGSDYLNPVISNDFGIGDISNLSFLEFIELIQRKMINATNRKIVTDYSGGWYPTLLKIYITYLERANLSTTDPLRSNGYTFENLYPFLSKYNAFFQKFVDQLLPATIILRKSGLLIRNSIFTKQKFTYKRGVNFDKTINYFGDDGSLFLKRPLTKIVSWTSDHVCVDELCKNLIISGITITYPTTTTTTTLSPYTAVIVFNSTITQQYISTPNNSGYYRKYDIDLQFNPEITPTYVVNMNLNSNVFLSGATNINDSSTVVLSLYKNNIITNTTIFNQSGTTDNDQVISIENGDLIKIIIENTALTTGVNLIDTEITLTPTILSVSPNGGEFTLIPESITNTINSSGI